LEEASQTVLGGPHRSRLQNGSRHACIGVRLVLLARVPYGGVADLNDDAFAFSAADPSRAFNYAIELSKDGGMTAEVATRLKP